MDFLRRLKIFSNEFAPSSPKSICTDICLRRDGGKIIEKIKSILEKPGENGSKLTACFKIILVKLLRAIGGCLGINRR